MAQRVTDTDLHEAADYINNAILNLNPRSKYEIIIGHRYGYTAIDLGIRKKGGIHRTIISGLTKSEAGNFLFGMTTGIDLIS